MYLFFVSWGWYRSLPACLLLPLASIALVDNSARKNNPKFRDGVPLDGNILSYIIPLGRNHPIIRGDVPIASLIGRAYRFRIFGLLVRADTFPMKLVRLMLLQSGSWLHLTCIPPDSYDLHKAVYMNGASEPKTWPVVLYGMAPAARFLEASYVASQAPPSPARQAGGGVVDYSRHGHRRHQRCRHDRFRFLFWHCQWRPTPDQGCSG